MADKKDFVEEAKIHPASRKLQEKIGAATLDQILTPAVIGAAQEVIVQSSEQFLTESKRLFEELQATFTKWKNNPAANIALLPVIVDTSFSLKTQAGLAGYDLVFDLGKSLQLHCEKLGGTRDLTVKDIEIVRWHIDSMRELLRGKIKGKGGEIGAAISTELERLLKAIR